MGEGMPTSDFDIDLSEVGQGEAGESILDFQAGDPVNVERGEKGSGVIETWVFAGVNEHGVRVMKEDGSAKNVPTDYFLSLNQSRAVDIEL